MIDYELIEALAAAFRAYATSPLSTCEVHEWDQIGYEGAAGSVVIQPGDGSERHMYIGDEGSLRDYCPLIIYGYLPHADTQTSRRNISLLRSQLCYVLRQNRTLTGGDSNALCNSREPITWGYGQLSEGRAMRFCRVVVTYEIEPDAAT